MTPRDETLQQRIVRLLAGAAALAEDGDLGGAISMAAEARMSWEDAGSPEEAEDD